jgi:hypothetical protein
VLNCTMFFKRGLLFTAARFWLVTGSNPESDSFHEHSRQVRAPAVVTIIIDWRVLVDEALQCRRSPVLHRVVTLCIGRKASAGQEGPLPVSLAGHQPTARGRSQPRTAPARIWARRSTQTGTPGSIISGVRTQITYGFSAFSRSDVG